jgi:hypothetical protein
MSTLGQTLSRWSCAALMLSLFPLAASAQSAPAQNPRSQGPMIVERVQSGFLVAPEVKVTRFDRRTSELVGGYGGWLSDQTFFIGGGGYWMANRSRDRSLAYGGLVLGVMPRSDRTVSFGVKGLLGGGRATRVQSVTLLVDDRDGRFDGPIAPSRIVVPTPIVTNVRVRDEFWVAEPEANVLVRFSRHVHLAAGASYRFAGRERGRSDGLNGASGTIALQFGG